MRTEKKSITRFLLAIAIAVAAACATEPPPRPTQLDPSNPSAHESAPLTAGALAQPSSSAAPPQPASAAPEKVEVGHGAPNLIGVKPGNLDEKVRQVVPGYMTMGETGMADMGAMGMPVPANSIPMLGGKGKHDTITMGGMFTIVKVRDGIRGYKDPGWYENPPGTLAESANAADLRRDGIDVERPPPADDDPAA